jgi:WXXGXW repeat (2 copies)
VEKKATANSTVNRPANNRKVGMMRFARFACSFLLGVGLLAMPAPSPAQVAVGVSIRIGPPILPVYVQPICPEPGYIWVPGYWAYGDDGYYWVPGTWVEPPEFGLLWTPGYWGWDDGFYVWHAGYWGPEVGFYGGVNYGFGYTGEGFFGGYWRGDRYYYNRAVTNVDVTVVRNTYNTPVVNNNTTVNRVSFNGGPGGTTAQPSSRELAAVRERHVTMTTQQTQHEQAARADRNLLASVNHGRPDVTASVHPGEFHGHGAVESRTPANPNRPSVSQPSNGTRVNPALDQKHQQQTDRLRQQQDQERQQLQQRHQQESQKLQQRAADDRKQQEAQRRQQQQMQQMDRKHEQQQQKLQQKQQQERQRQESRPQKPEASTKPPHENKPPSQP